MDDTSQDELRFAFGKNWYRFVKNNFSNERLEAANNKLLGFLQRDDLQGLSVLDIGCGSGLHSYAAYKAGASKVLSFDYDEDSVRAASALRMHAGLPDNWSIEQGDVLSSDYMSSLGKWDLVYSWGVLHHTGDMWKAIENAQRAVAQDGMFFIALYSADADFHPSKEFWIEVKQKYNQSSSIKRAYMVWWYIWRFALQRRILFIPALIKQIWSYKFQRGMNYFADIRDWLGGWPMEYAGDQETVDFLERNFGFQLVNIKTGEACTEFLFKHSSKSTLQTTNVVDFLTQRSRK